MVSSDNVEELFKTLNKLTASDLPALQHVIETKRDELRRYNVDCNKHIKALEEMQSILRKRFAFVDEGKRYSPNNGKRRAQGENLERIITFLSNQDFPVKPVVIATSLEMSKASLYAILGKNREKFIKSEEGYELAARGE